MVPVFNRRTTFSQSSGEAATFPESSLSKTIPDAVAAEEARWLWQLKQ
jgi:hypothetical protein